MIINVSAEQAAELTAACKHVERDWQKPEASRWAAWLWCNAIGAPVIGLGRTALESVIDAHRLADESRIEQHS